MLLASRRSSLRRSEAAVVFSRHLGGCLPLDHPASAGACSRRILPELGRPQNDVMKLGLRRLKAELRSDRLTRECRSSKEADRRDLFPTASLQRIRSA